MPDPGATTLEKQLLFGCGWGMEPKTTALTDRQELYNTAWYLDQQIRLWMCDCGTIRLALGVCL